MMRAPMRLALAAFAGAAGVAAFAPLSWFPLAPVVLAVLFGLCAGAASPRAAAALGFAFGMGLFACGVSWIYVSLHEFGGMPAPMAAVAVVLFCAYLSLFPAAVAALFASLRSGRLMRDALTAGAAWTLFEWLRGWLLSGFPWLVFGNSQTPPSPLAGFAPVVGIYGISFLVAFLGAALGLAVRAARGWLLPALATGVAAAFGAILLQVEWTQPAGAPISVRLLQPNIPQSLKWQADLVEHWLRENLEMVEANPAQLVVLPETTLPLSSDELPPGYAERLESAAREMGGNVLFGIFTREEVGGRSRYFNSALSIGVDPQQRYRKSHLVAFGEYSPPGLSWIYRWLSIPMSDQSPGPAGQAPLELAGHRIAVNICYEDAFGEEITASLPEATILLNLTNTAWFGRSLAQPQHLQMSRMRALESGRFMVRATNTGVTAVISPAGEVVARLPEFEKGALTATVGGFAGLTPYARLGNHPAIGLALLVVLLALARR
jgi:apolipoprotein N-acyltransferase